MITSVILNLFYYAVYALTSPFRLLPDVTAETGVGSSIATAGSYINNINNFFPITTLMTIFLLILVIELGIATYKIIMWAVHRVKG